MFKVITGKALPGGSAIRQEQVVANAAKDLEAQLNNGSVERVCAVAPYLTDNEFQLVAIVELAQKKGGK